MANAAVQDDQWLACVNTVFDDLEIYLEDAPVLEDFGCLEVELVEIEPCEQTSQSANQDSI